MTQRLNGCANGLKKSSTQLSDFIRLSANWLPLSEFLLAAVGFFTVGRHSISKCRTEVLRRNISFAEEVPRLASRLETNNIASHYIIKIMRIPIYKAAHSRPGCDKFPTCWKARKTKDGDTVATNTEFSDSKEKGWTESSQAGNVFYPTLDLCCSFHR